MSNDPTTSSRQYEQTLQLDVPREAVWKALTDSGEVARWFAPEAHVEPRVGGEVRWTWQDHFDWLQTIDRFDEGRHLRTTYDAWRGAGDQPHPLFIDFHLEGDGGRTTLRLVHSGFGADASFDGEFDAISGGWPIELESLRLYLERHRGRDRQLVWTRAVVDDTPENVWRALSSADGFGCAAAAGVEPEGGFAFVTADGDSFEGTVLKNDGTEFVGCVTNRDHAWLRSWVGVADGRTMLWLWLATYGDAPVSGLQARWDAMVARLFGDRLVAGAGS
ncbi:MAG: SRPBCC domain-containing protein [Planctomycetes bacterium]|nr:SRPBCC domain-containing protein [Planctomycetota bacterium]